MRPVAVVRRFSSVRLLLACALALCVAALAAVSATAGGGPTNVVITGLGEHTYVVPSGVRMLHVVAVGAPGGHGYEATEGGVGGAAGQITADVPVTPGQTLYVEIGGPGADGVNGGPATGGSNGGGLTTNGGGAGGGASDIQTCAADACVGNSGWILAAGGGGGGGRLLHSSGGDGPGGSGGAAGADGGDGGGFFNSEASGGGGHAGTQTAPGAAGTGGTHAPDTGTNGNDGMPGKGGAGGTGSMGGGGGGGYFGGGSGGDGALVNFGGGGGGIGGGGGGGGGSSWAIAGSQNVAFGLAPSGTTPSVQITPGPTTDVIGAGSLGFGNQALGTVSPPQTVSLINNGGEELKVASMSITGPNAGEFFLTGTTCGSVAIGESCTATVRFVPQAVGPRAASLTMTSNAGITPATFPLSGNGTDPRDGSGSQGTGGQAAGGPPEIRFGLLIAFFNPKLTARTHHGVRVDYLTTLSADVTLVVHRGRTAVARIEHFAHAGHDAIVWNGRIGRHFARAGRYTLSLTATAGGQEQSGSIPLRLK